MSHTHHDHHHHHAHGEARQAPASSPLRASALARLSFVAVLLVGLWAAVSWAIA